MNGWDPTGRYLVLVMRIHGDPFGYTMVWDAQCADPTHRIIPTPSHHGYYTVMNPWDFTGRFLIFLQFQFYNDSNRLHIWDIQTRRLVYTLDSDTCRFTNPRWHPTKHSFVCVCDSNLVFYDFIPSEHRVERAKVLENAIDSALYVLAWSPCGAFLTLNTKVAKSHLRILEVSTGIVRTIFTGFEYLGSFRWHPRSSFFVACSGQVPTIPGDQIDENPECQMVVGNINDTTRTITATFNNTYHLCVHNDCTWVSSTDLYIATKLRVHKVMC